MMVSRNKWQRLLPLPLFIFLFACSALKPPTDKNVINSKLPRHAISLGATLDSIAKDSSLKGKINSAAFSPDGKYVVIGSDEAEEIVIWDIGGRQVLRKLKTPGGVKRDSLIWSSDGHYIFSNYRRYQFVHDPATGLISRWLANTSGGFVMNNQLNKDGNMLLATYEGHDKVSYDLAIFDILARSKHTFLIGEKFRLQGAFWAKDKIVTLGSDRTRERFLSSLDPDTGEISGRLVITSPINPAYDQSPSIGLKAICTNVDGTRMAITYQHPQEIDSTLKIVNLQTLTLEKSIPMSRDDELNSCQYSPDGRYLFLQNKVGPIRIVDTQTYQQIGSISNRVSEGGLAVSPDGRWLAIGQADELRLYRLHSIP